MLQNHNYFRQRFQRLFQVGVCVCVGVFTARGPGPGAERVFDPKVRPQPRRCISALSLGGSKGFYYRAIELPFNIFFALLCDRRNFPTIVFCGFLLMFDIFFVQASDGSRIPTDPKPRGGGGGPLALTLQPWTRRWRPGRMPGPDGGLV